jgi:glycosyltransferase involved in cell wall biosynthesis
MGAPLISCIVPVYNGERYLGEALDSILAQTHRPLHIIVADDGSTDRTADVARSYGERVTHVHQSNRGYWAAKNLGLSAAHGELIAFLDVDDLWRPDKLARQVARLRARPDIDLSFTRFENFWMPELAEEERRHRGRFLFRPQSAWSISTLLTRRTVFERLGDFHDGTRGLENMSWFLRARERGAVIDVMADVLMRRRFNVESFTRRGKKEVLDNFLPILKEWRDHQRRRNAQGRR